MTGVGKYRDSGQAFPIYITVVAGLLFLAFAYLAVGQAAMTRSEAQTAADAAALAAAQETRDQLAELWLANVLQPESWQPILEGKVPVESSCWRAHELAARNDAHLDACAPDGTLSYTVVAVTDDAVGDSIVPGTEDQRATERTTAVIDPLCSFEPIAEDSGGDVLPSLTCEDRDWELEPEDLTDLPGPEDLFDVHLAD
ncbi:pilus assembly protein TadG-related protein [Streptomyces sp. NPDC057381]|uniref:pilus assembly protein TadG-related protein n=1 Tax=Streptomyces sp. NPDC057381 TaxID=3346111 RepID=UPI0036431ADD